MWLDFALNNKMINISSTLFVDAAQHFCKWNFSYSCDRVTYKKIHSLEAAQNNYS